MVRTASTSTDTDKPTKPTYPTSVFLAGFGKSPLSGDARETFAGGVPTDRVVEMFDGLKLTKSEGLDATILTPNGLTRIHSDDRIAVVRQPSVLGPTDPGDILGVFKSNYPIHQPTEWMVNDIQTFLGGDVVIAGAGILNGGARFWVQIALNDTFQLDLPNHEPYTIRPILTGMSSVDGSLATQYRLNAFSMVCSNQMGATLGDNKHAAIIKIKHTKESHASGKRLTDREGARELFGVLEAVNRRFEAQARVLMETTVSAADWDAFLNIHTPLTNPDGSDKVKNALTIATNQRQALDDLYKYDQRVAPWAGSAFGVVQAVNTHAHWSQTVRNMTRAERITERTLSGDWDALDNATLAELDRALDLAATDDSIVTHVRQAVAAAA